MTELCEVLRAPVECFFDFLSEQNIMELYKI
jgi:hypothetical protein